MSMSTNIVAFRPPDSRWKQMYDIYKACADAGVSIPKEVLVFFDNNPPDAKGVEVNINNALTPWDGDYETGFEVHLDLIPKDVTILRFYNRF